MIYFLFYIVAIGGTPHCVLVSPSNKLGYMKDNIEDKDRGNNGNKADLLAELSQELDEDILKIDGFDNCVIGYSMDMVDGHSVVRLVYSITLIICALVAQDMDEEEAIEYFDYNIQGAYMGPRTPIYVHDFNLDDSALISTN